MAVLGAAGAGGVISNFPITFAKTTTWTCPCVMEAYVFVIGGGGSGGAGAYAVWTWRSQGGTAGGCAVSKLTLAAQDYDITIGAGGAPQLAFANYPNGVAGVGGAASTFVDGVGSIATMTGNGGSGGGVHPTDTVAAKTGGTATGGTIMNHTGGGTPAITVNESITSGGAVGLWEAGRDGVLKTGTKVNVGSLLQGDDGQDLTAGPSTWGQESSWFIPPLNISMTLSRYIYPTTATDGQARDIIPAGAKATGSLAKDTAYSAAYYYNSSPLAGGVGGSANYTNVSAGGGTLGAGGGGMISRVSSSYAMSGAGGHGGVIIIPISLGS